MSFSSLRIRLDSGSGEAACERLADRDSGAPEVLPMTAETGILARYISISVLCSARRKPCTSREGRQGDKSRDKTVKVIEIMTYLYNQTNLQEI